MKNTLVKYLDYEINEENPDIHLNQSQVPQIMDLDQATEMFDMSICTP